MFTKIHVDTKDVSKSLFSGSNFPSILPLTLTVFQLFWAAEVLTISPFFTKPFLEGVLLWLRTTAH